MKHIKFIFIIKILLYTLKIFPITIVSISSKQTIEASKKQKWFYILTSFPVIAYLISVYVFTMDNAVLRSNPYAFLGHFRGMFIAGCPSLTIIFFLSYNNHFVKSIQLIVNLEKELKLTPRKLDIISAIILLELLLIYSAFAIWFFLFYTNKIKDFVIRLLMALLTGVVVTAMMAIELLYINSMTMIYEYISMINVRLIIMKEVSGISTNIVTWQVSDILQIKTSCLCSAHSEKRDSKQRTDAHSTFRTSFRPYWPGAVRDDTK